MSTTEIAIDACALINVLATGCEVDIATVLDVVFVTTPDARNEVKHLHGPPDEEGNPTKIIASTVALETIGRLRIVALDPEWTDTLVDVAASLRDADASVVTLALRAGMPLASDDGRIRAVVERDYSAIRRRGTLALVREAATRLAWKDAKLRAVAVSLRDRGSFLPPKRDPDREWFLDLLGAEV